ncbi:hypothetical protein CLU79DRAFT_693261, partial [Phycomyces nitens]
MSSSITNHDVQFISPLWTDHALLQTTISLGISEKGRGLWRAHPALASNPVFLSALNSSLTRLFPLLSLDDPQCQWEKVKATMIKTAKKFSGRYVAYRTKLLKSLQSKRSRFLRSKPILAARLHLLPKYDQQIAAIQQEIVDTAALRAGLKWREHGEKSAGYLKRA